VAVYPASELHGKRADTDQIRNIYIYIYICIKKKGACRIFVGIPEGKNAVKYFTDLIQWTDGLLPQRLPAPHRLVTTQSSSKKSSLRKEDCGNNGTYD
jgi:hypothetical protein